VELLDLVIEQVLLLHLDLDRLLQLLREGFEVGTVLLPLV
jgi:hypothetical protein